MRADGPVLAVELSAGTGSLALIGRDRAAIDVRRWAAPPRGGPEAWRALAALLAQVDGGAEGLSLIAVGRGPGRYAGLRAGLIMAAGLSLPTGVPVRALGSAAALAAAVLREHGAARVAVAGDARRGHCWLGRFRDRGGWPEADGEVTLCPADELEARIGAGAVAVSPDWSRLAPRLARRSGVGPAWIEADRAPDARDLARLAIEAEVGGRPREPVAPIYLHPAVDPAPARSAAAQAGGEAT